MYFLMLTDEITQLPAQVPVIKPDLDRANPKIGISAMAFSADNRYLATKNGEIMSVMCIGVQKSNLTTLISFFFSFIPEIKLFLLLLKHINSELYPQIMMGKHLHTVYIL